MATTTASAATALRDLTIRFDRRVRAAMPFYPRIAQVVQSQGAEEKYGWLGDLPGMREWVGDRIFKELRAATYEVENKHWESSLKVSKTDIADARMLKYGPLIDALAAEASYHPDELMFDLFKAGEAGGTYNGIVYSGLGFDGQFFFDTDHSFGDSGSQSNDLTYAAATGTTPTADEFRLAYNAAYAKLLSYKGDNGKPFFRPQQGVQAISPLVFTDPTLYPIADSALKMRFDANGNAVQVMGNPELVPISYLTDATKFYVVNPNGLLKPFVFQEREPLSRQVKGMDDLEVKDAKFMTEARYNAGYGAWWNAVLTTFT